MITSMLFSTTPVDQVQFSGLELSFHDLFTAAEQEELSPTLSPTRTVADPFDNTFISGDYISLHDFHQSQCTRPKEVFSEPFLPSDAPPTTPESGELDGVSHQVGEWAHYWRYASAQRIVDERYELIAELKELNPGLSDSEIHRLRNALNNEPRREIFYSEPDSSYHMGLNWETSGWKAPDLHPREHIHARGPLGLVTPHQVSDLPPDFELSSQVRFPAILSNGGCADVVLEDDGIIAPWDVISSPCPSTEEYYDDYDDSDSDSDTPPTTTSSPSPPPSPRSIAPLPTPRSTRSSLSSPRPPTSMSSVHSGGSDGDVDSEYHTTPLRAPKRKARRAPAPKKKSKKVTFTTVPPTPSSMEIPCAPRVTPTPPTMDTFIFASSPLPSPKLRGAAPVVRPRKKHFPCPHANCLKICASAGDLRRHLESLLHKTPSYRCLAGGLTYTRVDALARHQHKDPIHKRQHVLLLAAPNTTSQD